MTNWRKLLLPLVPLYAAGIARKNASFDEGRAQPRSLAWPVISVGGISAGGSGKTPFVIMLAQSLAAKGWTLDVLSRGYGREGKTTERVANGGDAARFGDEPLLIARRAGVPVYVGASRSQAGELAEKEAGTQSGRFCAHVLDDGFQHRQLARKVDIVLVTRRDLEDGLLPAGNLREPLASLRRADILVVREEEAADVRDAVAKILCATRPEFWASLPEFWTVSRRIEIQASRAEDPRRGAGDHALNPVALRPIAFCALARPDDFANSLREAGVSATATVAFRDHYSYSVADMRKLVARAKASGADGFVTTEKDAVKLDPPMIAALHAVGPLAIAQLHVELLDAEAAMQSLERRVFSL